MKGAIYGDGARRQWTQVLGPHKFPFQNPLHQNAGHRNALARLLQRDRAEFHALVVFVGKAQFKTPLPDNVLQGGGDCIRYVKSRDRRLLTDAEVEAAVAALRAGRLPSSLCNQIRHARSVRQRHPKTDGPQLARPAKRPPAPVEFVAAAATAPPAQRHDPARA